MKGALARGPRPKGDGRVDPIPHDARGNRIYPNAQPQRVNQVMPQGMQMFGNPLPQQAMNQVMRPQPQEIATQQMPMQQPQNMQMWQGAGSSNLPWSMGRPGMTDIGPMALQRSWIVPGGQTAWVPPRNFGIEPGYKK